MFAKYHRIIPGKFDVEKGISEVGVGEAPGLVELLLDSPAVPRVTLIFVGTALHSVKVVGHVFDGVKTEAISFGAIHEPTSGADQVSADVFGKSGFIGREVEVRLRLDFTLVCSRVAGASG